MTTAQTDAREGWVPELERTDAGLTFDGCPLDAIAQEFGTPAWVVSRTRLEANFAAFADAFRRRHPHVTVAYSMKANATLAIVRALARCGAAMDCTGENELQIALMCGVAPDRIILNGNGKSDEALRAAAEIGVLQVNIDSPEEAHRLQAVAAQLGRTVTCVVRVQLDYDELLRADPSFDSTLHVSEGKFGSAVATGAARRAAEIVAAAPNLRFAGLHHHVGFSGYMADYSARREVMHHRECTRELVRFARELESELGVRCERLDLGGGFRGGAFVYLATPGSAEDSAAHPLPRIEDYVDAIVEEVADGFARDALPELQFETGGYQVANAAVFLARVVETKSDHGRPRRRYVTLDGSMQMFTAKGAMRVASQVVAVHERGGERARTDLVGQTCVYDALAENMALPELRRGDLVALRDHGAYTDTSGTQTNAIPRPATVLADRGRATLVKRRETLADVIGRNVIPPELWAP
jgi:diaminopimelate decarboxylase